MRGEIFLGKDENWYGRRVLFCINGKCMSGRIDSFEAANEHGKFTIDVSFIEPSYFEDVLIIGNTFTIQEASRILVNGKIIG